MLFQDVHKMPTPLKITGVELHNTSRASFQSKNKMLLNAALEQKATLLPRLQIREAKKDRKWLLDFVCAIFPINLYGTPLQGSVMPYFTLNLYVYGACPQ